jgi:hypothetical protein
MAARISALDPEFYARLIRESDANLRAMALKACTFAVEKTGLKYPAILAAHKTMLEGKELSVTQKREMGKLTATLDAVRITTDIRSRDRAGKTDTLSGRNALFQAKAANAVFMASNPDPLFAALEAIYEAYLATGDWPALKAVLTEK